MPSTFALPGTRIRLAVVLLGSACRPAVCFLPVPTQDCQAGPPLDCLRYRFARTFSIVRGVDDGPGMFYPRFSL